jgi:hypothetical protein
MFGYPMKFIQYEFTDKVTGEPVNRYRDNRNRYWLATSRWSLFRIEVTSDLEDLANIEMMLRETSDE